jgi:C4-dicarboxylate-specific signal transduction histidine kinase
MVLDTLRTGEAHERQEQRLVAGHAGQETEVYVLASSVRLWLEERPHVLLSLEDVTAQRQAERRLRQREAELAHMGRMHTVGELAGTLAHELNQPLFAINNYVRGIQRCLKKGVLLTVPELIEATDQASREVNRAANIVTHLREFVRGRQPRRSSVDIGPLLHQAVELVKPAARDRGVTVVIETGDDLPRVHADAVQIEQVLVNLLTNAIDAVSALPNERRRITVVGRLLDSRAVEIVVRDCGRGIPENVQGKLFEAFVDPAGAAEGPAATQGRSESSRDCSPHQATHAP